MKSANISSKVLHLPKKVYDSDGEGNENWQDDMRDVEIEESFEFYDDEGESSKNIKTSQENLEKIKTFMDMKFSEARLAA